MRTVAATGRGDGLAAKLIVELTRQGQYFGEFQDATAALVVVWGRDGLALGIHHEGGAPEEFREALTNCCGADRIGVAPEREYRNADLAEPGSQGLPGGS